MVSGKDSPGAWRLRHGRDDPTSRTSRHALVAETSNAFGFRGWVAHRHAEPLERTISPCSIGSSSKTLRVERSGLAVAEGCLDPNRTECNKLLTVSSDHIVLRKPTCQSAFCTLGSAKQRENRFRLHAMV